MDNQFTEFLQAKYMQQNSREHLYAMAQQMQSCSPLSPDARALITIPLRAEEPAGMVINTLTYLARQSLIQNAGIFFMVNADTQDEITNSPALEGVYEGMDEFGCNMPIYSAVGAYEEWGRKKTIGRIRMDLAALAMGVAVNHGVPLNQHTLLFTSDIDHIAVPQDYLRTVVRDFDRNPRINAQSGPCHYPRETMRSSRLLRYYNETTTALEDIVYKETGRVRLYGGNTAFRTSNYMAAGGHEPQRRLGEHAGLNSKFLAADPASVRYSSEMFVITSPRRYLAALRRGIPLASAHTTFGQKNDLHQHYLDSHYWGHEAFDWPDQLEVQLQAYYELQIQNGTARNNMQRRMMLALAGQGISAEFMDDEFRIENKDELQKVV